MSFGLASLGNAVATHGTVGRIVVASHAGSAPRETGTSMLVWQDGQSGTIGGGALEFEAVNALRARLGSGGPSVEKLSLGPALGQCCGGAVTLVSEVFTADDMQSFDAATPLHIRRVSGCRPRPLAFTRMTMQARAGQPARLLYQDGWLLEPIISRSTPLWIYGAGHVGRAIVAMMAPLPGFEITWVDTMPNRFPAAIPQGVTTLPAQNPAAVVNLAPPNARHLVLSYSHALDLELCHQLLSHGFAGAGLIGSTTKWVRFKTRLRSLGHTDTQVSRITCPIGDPTLGKHPQAIALGVATALVIQSRLGATTSETRAGATGGHAIA